MNKIIKKNEFVKSFFIYVHNDNKNNIIIMRWHDIKERKKNIFMAEGEQTDFSVCSPSRYFFKFLFSFKMYQK